MLLHSSRLENGFIYMQCLDMWSHFILQIITVKTITVHQTRIKHENSAGARAGMMVGSLFHALLSITPYFIEPSSTFTLFFPLDERLFPTLRSV